MEAWKNIDDRYSVSSLGRVKSCFKNEEKILKPSISPRGYQTVTFTRGEKNRKSFTVHRLVAFYFFGEESSKVVNHKDGNKLNNSLENLEYCTQQYNRRHSFFGKRRFVSPVKDKFKVMIRHSGIQEIFGYYVDKEEAYAVAHAQYFKIFNTFPWE